MLMHKLSIENQTKITISVVKVGFDNALRDVPSSECVNCLMTRNSLVHMCLLLYIFLQQIGKNSVDVNAESCRYMQR